MSKYIDADKLIAEIERQQRKLDVLSLKGDNIQKRDSAVQNGAYIHILSFIASLQQEQRTCKTCGFYENNCPFIRGKLIPYPNRVCEDYTYSAMKEQEQQEVDLEKEIEKYYYDRFAFISMCIILH